MVFQSFSANCWFLFGIFEPKSISSVAYVALVKYNHYQT